MTRLSREDLQTFAVGLVLDIKFLQVTDLYKEEEQWRVSEKERERSEKN